MGRKQKSEFKDRKWPFYVMFAIAAFMIFLDGMVTTPIALVCIEGATEINTWHAHWANSFGVSYFFFSTPITILLLFVMGRGVDDIARSILKDKSIYKYYHYAAYALFALVILTFGAVVINNYGIISHGI